MSALVLAYDLVNYSPADANPPQNNFQRVEQFINQDTINRDGSTAMTGQLKLAAEPIAALDAVCKSYVDALLPIGVILPYGGTAATVPGIGKWLTADGTPLATADYPELFAVLGYRYGGSGGNFNLPPMADRVPVGAGGTAPATNGLGGDNNAAIVDHVHNAKHAHTASSDERNTDHVHGLNNHTHSLSMVQDGTHGHGWGPEPFLYNSSTVSDYGLVYPGGGAIRTANWSNDGAHSHAGSTVGAPNNVSWTNWQSEGQAGWGQDRFKHSHSVTVIENDFDTGVVKGANGAGVAPTNRNMQAYVIVNYIVRVK